MLWIVWKYFPGIRELMQLTYMVIMMYDNISLFSIQEHHSVPSSVPHAQIPDRSPTKLLVNCEATFKDWKWNRVQDAARHGLVPLDAHSGARHRCEHELVDLNIWGRIMASVELWHNFTFQSQYQLLHGKFSQYPKEVQVEKTGIDFLNENSYQGQAHKEVLIVRLPTLRSFHCSHWDDNTWGNRRGPDTSWALCRSTWYELGWEMSICNGAKASIEILYFFRWMQLPPGGWEGL